MKTTPKMFVIQSYNFPSRKSLLFFFFRQTRGIALYPCTADNESELSFHANDIITQSKCQRLEKENLYSIV